MITSAMFFMYAFYDMKLGDLKRNLLRAVLVDLIVIIFAVIAYKYGILTIKSVEQ